MTNTDPDTPEPGPDATVDALHADIEATRHELGETVEALTAKLDVKQQVKQKVDDTKDLIADKAQVVRPRVSVSMVALIAVIVGLVVWKSRR